MLDTMVHSAVQLLAMLLLTFFYPAISQGYLFVDKLVVNLQAEEKCQNVYGTSLASIHSEADNLEAQTLCQPQSTDVRQSCVIGLNTAVEAGSNQRNFSWTDGTLFDYHNWNDGEPDNSGGEEWVVILKDSGKWNDEKKGSSFRVLCNDYDTGLTPTTNTTNYPFVHVDATTATITPVDATTATIAPVNAITATITPVDATTATIAPVDATTATIAPTEAPTQIGETKAQLKLYSNSGLCTLNCVQCFDQIDIIESNDIWWMAFTGNNITNCQCPRGNELSSNDDNSIDIAGTPYHLRIEKYIISDDVIEYGIKVNVLRWMNDASNCTISYFVNENEFLGIKAQNVLKIIFIICDLSSEQLTADALMESEDQFAQDFAHLFNVHLNQVNVSINVGSFCVRTNRRLLQQQNDEEVTIVIVFSTAVDAKAAQMNGCDEVDVLIQDIDECITEVQAEGIPGTEMESDGPNVHAESKDIVWDVTIAVVAVVTVCLCVFLICYLYQSRKKMGKQTSLFNKYEDNNTGDTLHGAVTRGERQKSIVVSDSDADAMETFDDTKEYKSQKEMIEDVLNAGNAHSIKQQDLSMGQQIGSGHFGTVYKAIWNGNTVAVKQLKSVKFDDDNESKRRNRMKEMKAEIVLASSIPTHKNLVEIFGYIQSPFALFGVVMGFMSGDSVEKYVYRSYKKAYDDIPTVLELSIIAKKTASGMTFLHKYGLIHRDISCRNILLGEMRNNCVEETTEVRISDFGLTRQLQYNNNKNKTEAKLGPLKWMAPESIKQKQYSKKSDVYMFGITMWEMFYGMEPYIDMNAVSVATHVVTKGQRPQIINDPHKYRHTEMTHQYQCLMEKCWDQKPRKRPDFSQILIQLDTFSYD